MRPISPELATLAFAALGALFTAGVQLGIWRERVNNIKHGLALEVRNLRENNNQRFDALDSEVAAMRQQLATAQDQRALTEHWKGGVDSKLQAQEQRLEQVERAVVAPGLRVVT